MPGVPAGTYSTPNGGGVGKPRGSANGGAGRARRLVAAIATVLSALALILLGLDVATPQRTGPLVAIEIFEPYLLLAVVPLVVLLTSITRLRVPLAVLLLLMAAVGMRYGPALASFPQGLPQGSQPIHVMSWNLEAGGVPFEQVGATIDAVRPDIVGLIELVPERSHAAEQDPRMQLLYPYRVLLPRSGVPGLGLMSRFPVIAQEFNREPPLLRVVIAPSDVDPAITVFVAHPYLAGIDTGGFMPDVQTSSRDAGISFIRSEIDTELTAGHDVLVLGDFNVTEREPAYTELTRDLHDAQREAGYALGLTWRPTRLENLPFGLLRIDYVLASRSFVAVAAAPDCTPRGSDHCLVTATFARPRTR